jgi:DnaK suppressor protein
MEGQSIMKNADAKKYKMLLMAKRAEIVGKAPQREDLWIVQSNEQIEMVQLAGQREFAARTLERSSKSLMQIAGALERIEDGAFGICLDCEEPISDKRLAAVPWAAYCLHCQEMRDAEAATDNVGPKLAA